MTDSRTISDVSLTPGQIMISSCSGLMLTSVFAKRVQVHTLPVQIQRDLSPSYQRDRLRERPQKHANVVEIQLPRTGRYVTPLDVVKIRMQAHVKPHSKGHFVKGNSVNLSTNDNTTWKKNWYKRPGNFNGVFDALLTIGRNEGITTLWSGLQPTLMMAIPGTVVYFTTYEMIKKGLGHSYNTSENAWWIPVIAGSCARVFASTVKSPLELIRTKMQSEQLTYKQLYEAVRTTLRNDGMFSLWRGLSPTLLRDVPFSALYWLSYETLKGKFLKDRNSSQLTFLQSFVSGACAGTIAGISTLPFDVIKTHRQIELGEIVFAKEKKEISSTWKLIQNLYRQQGIKALYSGLAPRIMNVAPACAIIISTYEYSKHFFRQRNLELLKNR